MQNVNVSLGFDGFESETITFNHLGGHILLHSDRVDSDSDFNSVISKTGIQLIRYPGGTVTEEYFDITDPNSRIRDNILDIISGSAKIRRHEVVPLDEFLSNNNDIGARASIVLPTYRYFDHVSGEIKPEAEIEIKTFVRELLTGIYGPAEDVILEIGNEWYQDRFDWNIDQFGSLQATIATWIDEEAHSLGLRDSVTLLAQAGRSTEGNEILSSYFESTMESGIDGVLTHFYGTNSSANPLGLGGGGSTIVLTT